MTLSEKSFKKRQLTEEQLKEIARKVEEYDKELQRLKRLPPETLQQLIGGETISIITWEKEAKP